METNPGRCPPVAQGKRVHVVLRCGYRTKGNLNEPNGWAADTTRWELTGHRNDVIEWELAG